MFFIKLEGSDLERALKLSAEKKVPVERLARLAFLKGFRLLVKTEIGAETSATLGRPSRKSRDEVDSYVRQNWENETDEQMGEALDYAPNTIRLIRRVMGLKRRKGRPNEGVVASYENKRSLRKQRREQLDALINEHWETKDDWEIGRMMEPHVPGTTVRIRRLNLGLKKKAGNKHDQAIRTLIDQEEFEHMIVHEGYTMSEYLRLKNLHFSRQRLEQVAVELGLKHSPQDRAPEWEVKRMARKLNNLNLANRDWLGERLSKAISVHALAAELEVDEYGLTFFIRRFGLTHPQMRKYGVMTVDLVCAQCGAGFKRLKRWVDRRVRTGNGQPLEYFCSTSCTGLYNRVRSERRKAEGLPGHGWTITPERAKKMAEQNTYISEHWQSMSDSQMGEALSLAKGTVEDKRLALGFKRVTKAA